MTYATEAQTSADQIMKLECDALDRWGKGDPGGFLDLYARDITYFDPVAFQNLSPEASEGLGV